MGLVAEVLQFFRGTDDDAEISEAKGELGGGDVVTSVNYPPAGYDAFPLTTDYMLLVPGPEAGTFLVAGYLDPLNAGTAREGDVRLYCRDAEGAVTGEFYLAQDGAEPDWQAEEIGALIARADRVDAELQKIKTELEGHEHKYDRCGGGTTGLTGPVNDTVQNSASYDRDDTGADKGWVT